MKSKFLVMFSTILFILVSVSMVAVAQDDSGFVNDPAVNELANACYDGGSMEGKCNFDADGDGVVSAEEIEWQWTCGWHLIRLEANMISEANFPSDCVSLINDADPIPTCPPGSLTSANITFAVGGTTTAISPLNDSNCGESTVVSLSSSNTSIATISGLDVTCVAAGSVTITRNFESEEGDFSIADSFTCTV